MFKRFLLALALAVGLGSPVLAQTTREMPQAWEAATPFAKHMTPAQLTAVAAGMSGDSCATKTDLEPLFVAAETDVTMQSNTPYSKGAAEIDLPPGCYWFAETWSPHHPLLIRGVSAPGGVGGSTILNWPANTPGIVATSGVSGNPSGLTLENVSLLATKSSTIDPLGTENAITANVVVNLKDVNAEWWAADCFHVDTLPVGAVADFSRWDGGHCHGNGANSRYCTYTVGNDSNAISVRDVQCTNVGGMGFADASGTGGNYSGGGVESSGSAPALYLVNQAGASFRCINPIPGQCKGTVPGSNSSIWAPITFSASYGAYSSAINYIGAGALYGGGLGNKSSFDGIYVEQSDPPINVQAPGQVLGGAIGPGAVAGAGGGSPVMSASAALNIVGSFHTTTGGWAATDYSTNGTVHAVDATLGGNGPNCDVLGANNVTQGADVYRWNYANCGPDLYETSNNASTVPGRIFTMPTTTFTGGRSAIQVGFDVFPRGAFFGQTIGGARWFSPCPGAAPTTGAWGTGDLCWNTSAASVGDVLFWINTSGGTPGTWTIGGYLGAQANLATANHWTAAQQIDAVTNGKGLQAFNTATTCTTAATIGALCTTSAVTLPAAYADTNYRLTCTGLTPTNLPTVLTVTKSNTSFTIELAALTAAAATFASFDCIAAHN